MNKLNLYRTLIAVFLLYSGLASAVDLQSQLDEIDAKINKLAKFNWNSGVGNVGWISKPKGNPKRSEWIQIELPKNSRFDQVALFPLITINAEDQAISHALPETFRIVVGKDQDTTGEIITEVRLDDLPSSRMAPLVINTPNITNASWVRIESESLTQWARDDRYAMGFAEVLIFDGYKNIALSQPVKVSSTVGGWGTIAIFPGAANDGFTPFVMDCEGKSSNPYNLLLNSTKGFSLVLDLEKNYPVDQLAFHRSCQVEKPQIFHSNFGVPLHFVVEGSTNKEFTSTVTLCEYKRNAGGGPIISFNIPETECRYIRITIPRPFRLPAQSARKYAISFAEIEVFSKGINVAKNKLFLEQKSENAKLYSSHLSNLTDGLNQYGQLKSIHNWVGQLAQRHELERERDLLSGQLNQSYQRQKKILKYTTILTLTFAACLLLGFLVARNLQKRAIWETRKRIAADLHDELSANLHALSLIGDVALLNLSNPEKLKESLTKIKHLAQQNQRSVRRCSSRLKQIDHRDDFASELEDKASRLLSETEFQLTVEDDAVQNLSLQKRDHLLLFYQECLINIARHSKATICEIVLTNIEKKKNSLTISDNGIGVRSVPPSLKRRARLMGGRVKVINPEVGGTQICLTFQN